MPIAYQCDPRTRLVVEVFHGDVSFAEFRDHTARQVADPAWLATTRALSDLSTARIPSITDAEYEEIVALLAERPDHARGREIAVLGGQSWGTAKGAEKAALSMLGARALVFDSIGTACVWLGVDLPVVQATIVELHDQLRPNT